MRQLETNVDADAHELLAVAMCGERRVGIVFVLDDLEFDMPRPADPHVDRLAVIHPGEFVFVAR